MPYAPDKMPMMNVRSKMRMCVKRGWEEALGGAGVEVPLINRAVGMTLLAAVILSST